MAAFTSKAAGNASAGGQTTWNEAGVPTNGDTYTISHAVNIDVDMTIGHSPGAADATPAILIANTGILTVNEGITLTVRGDIKHANASAKRSVLILDGGHL